MTLKTSQINNYTEIPVNNTDVLREPDLFKKKVYDLSGLDSYITIYLDNFEQNLMPLESISGEFTLSPNHITTSLVTREPPTIEEAPNAALKTVLFLPEGEGRQGEGGLRTQGYFKHSQPYKPLITVITVVFNGEKYLEETILSVINQTYDNMEYIIIDGGSTDGTLDVIRKYEDAIDYWVSEKDQGIYDAMNKGWRLTSEQSMILYLGAGDKIHTLPSASELEKNKQNIVYGNVYIGNHFYSSRIDFRLKLGNTLHHQALLVPKKIHPHPPFNIKYKIYADYDFNLRLFLSGKKYFKSQEFLSFALPDGVSSKINIIEINKICRENLGYIHGLTSYIYISLQKIKIWQKRIK
ncbi:glycosyltransferase family 2 protein [Thiothrix subterranea]|uniref:Glycosyltransferase family 2 protein n=1 Tax=Thiothrix subterranea TaxID=2735563 RepID=A0ABU0Y426_9GAMM|nr:glycosyltransferase family 2 protein [Thiothrix subterranea]MDQ5767545.1 glycosyltransferase family 2 protein [Thiothrix subterranea]